MLLNQGEWWKKAAIFVDILKPLRNHDAKQKLFEKSKIVKGGQWLDGEAAFDSMSDHFIPQLIEVLSKEMK